MDKMHKYFNSLHNILTQTEVTDANRERVDTTTAIDKIIAMLEAVRDARAKNVFIGNGLEDDSITALTLAPLSINSDAS